MGNIASIRAALLLLGLTLFLPASVSASDSWIKDGDLVVVVGAPFVELHLFPGRGYPRFHAVEKHQKMRVLKRRTDWYQVQVETGERGWVHRKDLHTLYDLAGQPIAFATPTWHQAEQNPWQLGLLAGELGGTLAYTLQAGYRFTPHISGELRYSQAFGEFSHNRLGTARLMHQPLPHWRVSPFIALGAGIMQVRPDAVLVQAEDREDNTLSVGGGLLIYFSHALVARLEYSQHTVLTTRPNNEEVNEWQVGFSVLF